MRVPAPAAVPAAVALCCLFAAAARPASAQTTIDFNDIAAPPDFATPVGFSGDRYLSQGVRLSTTGIRLVAYNNPDFADSDPISIAGSSNGLFADRPLILDFFLPGTLTPAATATVSCAVTDFQTGEVGGGQTYRVQAFGAGGVLLEEQTGTATSAVLSLNRPVAEIVRVVFTPSSDRESFDTLTFGPLVAAPNAVVVPEAGTLALLPLAAAFGMASRRRRDA